MNDNEKIEYLSKDKSFGIYTRNAIDLMELNFTESYIIDINNLKMLNSLLGYEKTNKIIHNSFKKYKKLLPDDILGRWFYGDEIIIFTKQTPQLSQNILLNCFRENNISFKILSEGKKESEKE